MFHICIRYEAGSRCISKGPVCFPVLSASYYNTYYSTIDLKNQGFFAFFPNCYGIFWLCAAFSYDILMKHSTNLCPSARHFVRRLLTNAVQLGAICSTAREKFACS